ncbi:MAG: hypothetical protein ACJ77K_09575 [Bacteroidia bacterium]
MENIVHLVKNLQTGEIKLLTHFYKYQKDHESKKINLLFELAIRSRASRRPEDLDRKALERLYSGNKKHEMRLSKLKWRLKTDIMNILLLQSSAQKFSTKHDLAIFDCRRMLIQGEILMSRGIYCEGIQLLERASSIAQKNELYAEQILIDELCRNYNLLRSGEREFFSFMKRIEKNSALLEKLQSAKHFHYEMTASKLFENGNIQPIEEWEQKLEMIRKDYEKSRSVKIGFYYHLSALTFYREVHQFGRSLESGLALLKNAASSDILKTSYYSGKINLEVAKCYLQTEDYDEAIKHAGISNKHFQKDLLNELTTLEILLHCYMIKGDKSNIEQILEKAFSKIVPSEKFTIAKWNFLRAGVDFRSEDYCSAQHKLKDCAELMKDKNGWVMAYSFFEVICKIETGNHDWFEYRSDALKKLLMRHAKGHSGQQKRFNVIFKILKTLHKNGYDYLRTVVQEKENINLLSEIGYSYSWNMNGYEPVQFDHWIKAKAAKQLKENKAKSKLVA